MHARKACTDLKFLVPTLHGHRLLVWLLVSRSKAENQKTYQGSGLILMLLFFKAPCRADTPEECAAIIGNARTKS